MRLAKYIALHSSLSRRQAEEAIQSGRVQVNGVLTETPVYFVSSQDQVQLDLTLLTPSAREPCSSVETHVSGRTARAYSFGHLLAYATAHYISRDDIPRM